MAKSFDQMKREYLAELDKPTNSEKLRKRLEYLDEQVPDLFHAFSPTIDRECRQTEFFIDGFLPKGYLVILAGRPKEGKTCLATAMALAVATGRPFAGMKTEYSPVLWIANEESPRERAAILRQFHLEGDPMAVVEGEIYDWMAEKGPFLPLFTSYQKIPIDTEDGLYLIERSMINTGAKLIVIDPLMAAISGRSLNDGWAARKSLEPLKAFCWEKECTALVLHHTKRGYNGSYYRRVADSDQLAATASMEMVLTRDLTSGPPLHFPAPPQLEPQPLRPREANGEGAGGGEMAHTSLPSCLSHPSTPIHPKSEIQNPKSRILTLVCRGRGDFANRRWHFTSNGPLDFQLADRPAVEFDRPSYLETQVLKHLSEAERSEAMNSHPPGRGGSVTQEPGWAPTTNNQQPTTGPGLTVKDLHEQMSNVTVHIGSIQRVLADLLDRGELEIAGFEKRSRRYRLVRRDP